jgi:hypothetical protein
MRAKVIDEKFTNYYGKEMFVLWISKHFYHLGFNEGQAVCDLYLGESQIELIKETR